MRVTLFTDGSYDTAIGLGGWGAYSISERGRAYQGGGLFSRMDITAVAELESMYEGVQLALRSGVALEGDTILIQNDSQSALALFENFNAHKDYPMNFSKRTPSSGHEERWKAKFWAYVNQHDLKIQVRWIKGHRAKWDEGTSSKRHKLNDFCDDMAKKGLQIARHYQMDPERNNVGSRFVHSEDQVFGLASQKSLPLVIDFSTVADIDEPISTSQGLFEAEHPHMGNSFSSTKTEGLKLYAYTDGSCLLDSGDGGWAALLYATRDGVEIRRRMISGFQEDATNNQMELEAVIQVLQTLTWEATITIYSDSRYVVDGISSWLPNWKRNNWMRKVSGRNKPIANLAQWKLLDGLLQQHMATVQWIKGHNGNEFNELADAEARRRVQTGRLK